MTINIVSTADNFSAIVFMKNKADTSKKPTVTVWKVFDNLTKGSRSSIDTSFSSYYLDAGYAGNTTFPAYIQKGTAHSFVWNDQAKSTELKPLASNNPNAVEITNNTNANMWVNLKTAYSGQGHSQAELLLQMHDVAPNGKATLEIDTVLHVVAVEAGMYKVGQKVPLKDVAKFAIPVDMTSGNQDVNVPGRKKIKKKPNVVRLYVLDDTYATMVGQYYQALDLEKHANKHNRYYSGQSSSSLYSQLENYARGKGVEPHMPGIEFPDGGVHRDSRKKSRYF